MRAEGIAGHQNLILNNVSIHTIRPMKIWQGIKTQGFITNAQLILILHGNTIKITIYNLLQKADGRWCGNNFCPRAFFNNTL
ncbi:hypothetical protein SDC9_175117 [bioreactor metagenome]|uniref:Uncharacterized protein n=1 Tax=bioreactor metagenome TaxID=1076179 RepID=A0A645GVM5_9ZZZZ